MKMSNLLACKTKTRAIDLSVQKRCMSGVARGFSYLDWINNSDKIFVGRVISRQVEYQEVYQSQKGDQNYYRFGAFSVERREEYYMRIRRLLLPILRKTCCPNSKFFAENCAKKFPETILPATERGSAFFTQMNSASPPSPVYYPVIILLSYNFKNNILSSLCGFSFRNKTVVVAL